MRYDVAVVGLGGMGSAALAHLAARGVRAVGIEQFERLHDQGASSGESRIIRKAYFEDPAYVPLLERAYALWRDLETQTHRTLLDLVGVLLVGTPDREAIAGSLESGKRYGIPLEIFETDQLARRFAGTTPLPGEIGVLEREAGIVFPEAALDAHLDRAAALGAEMRFSTKVERWERAGGAYRLHVAGGQTVEAARLVFCPGMWSTQLLGPLPLSLNVQRNVQVWFAPSTGAFDRDLFPAFLVQRPSFPAALYGFPAFSGTLKAALHSYGDAMDPKHPERRIRDADVTAVRDALESWMPGAATGYVRGKVCPYVLTPDRNFIIDRLPGHDGVTIACGFSGHGYKFCPVVGEIVADLCLDGASRFDIGFLALDRPGA